MSTSDVIALAALIVAAISGEQAMTVRVLYRRDEGTWVASSPDVPRWTVVADTYTEAHRLAEEGVRFTLEREDLAIEHYVPAGVALAA